LNITTYTLLRILISISYSLSTVHQLFQLEEASKIGKTRQEQVHQKAPAASLRFDELPSCSAEIDPPLSLGNLHNGGAAE